MDEVDVVDDLQRFRHVVGHHDRGQPERIVQTADQVGDGVERDRVEAGEGLVVDDQHGVERDRPRQRHAALHAARQFARHQGVGAAQADGVELHQHQIMDHLFRQIGMLAHREGNVVENRQVAEQPADLEHHAHLPAHGVEPSLSSSCTTLPSNLTLPRDGLSCPPKWRSSVDLPHPLTPRMATIFPRGMVRLMPLST